MNKKKIKKFANEVCLLCDFFNYTWGHKNTSHVPTAAEIEKKIYSLLSDLRTTKASSVQSGGLRIEWEDDKVINISFSVDKTISIDA